MADRPPKGVVLDFDGVLADSMRRHAEAYRQVLAPFGASLTDRDVFLLEGSRSETIFRDVLRRAGQALDDAAIRSLADEKQRIYARMGPPPLYPGARVLVESLHGAGVPLGLVTGTRMENLERAIPEWLPWFRAVMAQHAYSNDKPHPEPYAKAAQAMGIQPARLAALENAQRGVQSARAAGYDRVVAITTTLERRDFDGQGADAVVASHADAARDLLRWWQA